MRRRLMPAVLAGTLLVSGLSGCSLFGSSVSQDEVEDIISDKVGEAEDVRCKGDLEGEEDAKQTCAIQREDGDWLEFDIVVTKVDGDTVEFEPEDEQTPLDGEPDY
ncbi:MAG TPA: DUF4333 domain-containing protein [Candidatus Corynebacterium avicola]|uniref:DUF4333 domain-containing protein n=1 Tax=Candidatus Corynebacterium avicola TaxID=2838527 RepID=A0A9D1UL77_9CORY|nr:DUF4333 domain-containing protein [Candidatus Corynebacterium avicola]